MMTSGYLVRFILSRFGKSELPPVVTSEKESEEEKKESYEEKKKKDAGALIGKCENILILIFILIEAYDALAIIFAGKSIARSEAIKRDPKLYLGGTLINVSYSIVVAIAIKIAIFYL